MATRAASKKIRGRGGKTQPEAEAPTTVSTALPTPRIQWEGKEYMYRTNLLVSYCRNNPDFRLKMFSDLTQDAIMEGRTCWQMSANKDKYYQQIADYVFRNDNDLSVKEAYGVNPIHFVGPVRNRFLKLKTKYNDFNKSLGLSGAGITSNSGLDDFHGWWKDNPAFNHTFSIADPGQDFVAEAEEVFSQPKQTVAPVHDDWIATEAEEVEEVEEVEGAAQPQAQDVLEDTTGSGQLEVDRDADSILADPKDPSASNAASSGLEMEDIVGTFSAHVERMTVGSSASAKAKGKQKAISTYSQSCICIPQTTASSSRISSPIASTSHHPPTSVASSHISPASNVSSSHKRPRDIIERTSDLLGDKNESLLGVIRDSLSSQDESKPLKYSSIITVKEIKVREARDQREHDLRLLMAQQAHEESVAAQNTKTHERQMQIEELKLKHVLALAAIQSSGHSSASGVDAELKKVLMDSSMDQV